jgi:Transposase DDE domain
MGRAEPQTRRASPWAIIARLSSDLFDASRYLGKVPNELDWSEKQRQSRAVREYFAALDENAEPNPDRKPPKVVSPSDPSSAWTAKANKRVQFGYGINYLIDIDNGVIVDLEATPARTYDEVAATKTMLDRTDICFGLKPKRLVADTAYGTGKFLGWLVEQKKITPHIPVWDKVSETTVRSPARTSSSTRGTSTSARRVSC